MSKPTDLRLVFSGENLKLAWNRIKSNPDAGYKNYFRPIYQAYASAEEAYLKQIGKRLRCNHHCASTSTKIFLPKASGILRPITLLTIEDQIVYQAFGNAIAERLARRIRRHYYNKVFGNIYAGKNSRWFYSDWRFGYRQFNAVQRRAFEDGLIYTAEFDLTACFDSLDHAVLRHYLTKLKFSPEFIQVFLSLLSSWSSISPPISHAHGIPQGPITSGLIAEVVLQVFDVSRLPSGVRYFRFVDDIKLFAKSERDLRRALVALDYTSKMVGLFPQSSKIGIHKISDIEKELKSVSIPAEPPLQDTDPDQDTVHKRINELSPRYVVSDNTRFKFNLARANPRAIQNQRLLRILEMQPSLYSSIFSHFARYEYFPKSLSQATYHILTSDEPPYFSFQAHLLDSMYGKVRDGYPQHVLHFCQDKWKKLLEVKSAANYRLAVARWIIGTQRLNYKETCNILERETSGWLQARALFYVNPVQFGDSSYSDILSRLICSDFDDVAVSAAFLLMKTGGVFNCRVEDINPLASHGMREYGIRKTAHAANSQIPRCLIEICKIQSVRFSWKRKFGQQHKDIEKQLLLCLTYFRTDATAFFLALDVAFDLILAVLFQQDRTLGNYILGNIGGTLSSNTSRFARKYPKLFLLCVTVHDRRKQADLSHAINRTTKKRTERLKFKDMFSIGVLFRDGIQEMISKWP